eukprot:867190-Prymnesium_polylepis.1
MSDRIMCTRRSRNLVRVYVGGRFGTFFACPPGMTRRSGADCSTPGIAPWTLPLAGVTANVA